jgi:cell division inhibitor SulA/protein ImuA
VSTGILSFTALLGRPDIWRGDSLGRVETPSIPSGFCALDSELPGGGWPAGALTEIQPAHEGIGELRLLGPTLAALSKQGSRLAWIAPPHLPYVPALAAAGVDMAQVVIVRTASPREILWAAEQALRSNACGAVLVWLQAAKYTELRRLQLAAEEGCAAAFLFRPGEFASEPSPAALRIALGTTSGGLAVHLLKRRGAPLAHPILLPAIPPAIRSSSKNSGHHVDRHPAAAAAARNFPARLVHA